MNIFEDYALYLRKSRADMDAEARGEGETLKKHETALLAIAKKMNINISKIYREIVSGERVADRPEMQQLLQDVEDGKWAGVLVMEIERLARGDTMDQGFVAQAFKYSGTKIITPVKVYDPDNEFDEEYFEFGLFMSRREYKTINRRQQAGRIQSVKEGNYIGNTPPYGYNKIRLEDKSYSLTPNPEQAPIVKMIYDMYTTQNMGMGNIAKKLNLLGVPTARGSLWVVATISGILQNPVYNGEIVWNRRPEKKTRKDGQIQKKRPEVSEDLWIRVPGKHEAIITKETWDMAQRILKGRYHVPAPSGVITSSLAGLVRCSLCGRLMVRRPYSNQSEPSLICVTPLCKQISSQFILVEERILEGLRIWINQYKAKWDNNMPVETENTDELLNTKSLIVKDLEKTLGELRQQSSALHDLLERGVYSIEVFMERSQNLSERIADAENGLSAANEELNLERHRREAKAGIIPQVEHVLDVYDKIDDPSERNSLLKSVLQGTVYSKEKRGHWRKPETMREFDMRLYPKLPEQ
ncbi:recombinase family protein [Paenibacillus sp. FSL K6-3166]|uniref:recombinase family protein n=1 Tax=unclassified Paenibacillus TaxID=185978 RepID=UPI000BA09C16|nr:recombinase family protein [Paenibacillus sp. VTT E-133291]OZQ95877.1 recombinase family protein [Paenibacillus sp. VTT E-133291]